MLNADICSGDYAMIKGTKGFTLVETVIATALLILSLALFLGTFVQARRSAAIADHRLDAVNNARLGMENLLACKYASTQLNSGSRTSVVAGVTNYYSVSVVTQTPGIVVKNIALTNRWVNPMTRATSTVSLAVSMSEEFHK